MALIKYQTNICLFFLGRQCEDMEPRTAAELANVADPFLHLQCSVEPTYRRSAECCMFRWLSARLGLADASVFEQPSHAPNTNTCCSCHRAVHEFAAVLSAVGSSDARLEQVPWYCPSNSRSRQDHPDIRYTTAKGPITITSGSRLCGEKGGMESAPT